MIREICRDETFLAQKAAPATADDLATAQDLLDTLTAHKDGCVGMAANMIGIRKNIIIVNMGIMDMVMFNPRILSANKPFETEEGCLSLTGVRKTTRYEEIEVEFRDMDWKLQRRAFTGWTAQIIQHEVDHCNGIVI